MATTDDLDDKARKSIARQTAPILAAMKRRPRGPVPAGGAGLTAPKAAATPKHAEDFVHCTLSLDGIENPPADLTELLEPKGVWLHLLRTGDTAPYFTTSEAQGFDDAHRVLAVTEGTLAQKIFDAVRALDTRDGKKKPAAVVRVVAVPALYAYALAVLRKAGPTAIVLAGPPALDGLTQADGYPEIPFRTFLTALAELRPGPDRAAAARPPGPLQYG